MKNAHVANEQRRVVLVDARYTEMFGSAAGNLLSQIVYWFKPGKSGKTKLRVRREGCLWLAKRRQDWAVECGLSPRRYDTAVSKLISAGVVKKEVWRFAGSPTVHLHLVKARLSHLFGDLEITDLSDSNDLPVISYTETTTETTAESEDLAAAPQKRKEQAIEKVGAENVGHGGGKKKCGAAEKPNGHGKKPVAAYSSHATPGKVSATSS